MDRAIRQKRPAGLIEEYIVYKELTTVKDHAFDGLHYNPYTCLYNLDK